jgi:Co/Zn/Cd efflux system component
VKLSAHLQIEGDANLSSCDVLLKDTNSLLDSRYAIRHSTIQFECANCDPTNSDLYCSMSMGEKH